MPRLISLNISNDLKLLKNIILNIENLIKNINIFALSLVNGAVVIISKV